MIYVDKNLYTKSDFQTRYNELSKLLGKWPVDGALYTICLKHPFDILSSVLFLRDQGGSVLLLNGDTPFETAKAMAEQAQSNMLLYGNWDTALPLSNVRQEKVPALWQYSSGTTGKPKLIPRTWGEVDVEVRNYNRSLSSGAGEQAVLLVPVSHSFGLIAGALTAIARESNPYILYNKNPKFALHMIKEVVPESIVYGVPFLFHLLYSFDKDGMRFHKALSSGAPLSESLFTRLKAASEEVWHQYGSTETGCITLAQNPSSPFEVGKPLKHMELLLEPIAESDDSHSEWKEVVVKLESGKIVRTRDIGYWTKTQSLCVVGRNDDLINVSGLKVIPSEVETVLERMPGVSEAAVFKTRHKVWGEAAKALVVATDGIKETEVREWCVKHLPSYKVPGAIELVQEIPKMPSGKISRKLLQERESV